MSAWQPIATAPQSVDVLVFCPEAAEDSQIMICCFLIGRDDPDDDGDWYEQNPSLGSPIDVEPTHWMPLPERPVP